MSKPWMVDRLTINGELVVREGDDVAFICMVFGENKEQNAGLIAAAPDLLAASKLALDALRNIDPGEPEHFTGWASDEGCEAYAALWNAIAKAEGTAVRAGQKT